MKILVGTCGFPGKRDKIFSSLDAVEIQESFYSLLGEKKIENLRKQKPPDFIYTFKAWQATTHPHTSPTWKRMKTKPKGDIKKYGWLRATEENLWALQQTLEQAIRIDSRALVFQTPASMPHETEIKKQIEKFFEKALELSGSKVYIAWEPRGVWREDIDFLKIIYNMGIIIVSDVLKHGWIFTRGDIGYIRLHGLGEKEVNYRYKYTDNDLVKLYCEIEEKFEGNEVYVMFNNVYMLEDAIRFKEIIRNKKQCKQNVKN